MFQPHMAIIQNDTIYHFYTHLPAYEDGTVFRNVGI